MQPIRTWPAAVLTTRAAEVTAEQFADGTVARVVAELEATMAAFEERTGQRALGMAAPQIGHSLRIFKQALWPGAFVNPTLDYGGGSDGPMAEEECMSLPGVRVMVGRAVKIKLRYLNAVGEERATKMRDKDARVAQHEYDHLNGVLITTRGRILELPGADTWEDDSVYEEIR